MTGCGTKKTATNFVHAKNKPMKQHELISIFSLGNTLHKSQSNNRMNYYPQGLIEINKFCSNNKHSDVNFTNRPSHKDKYVQTHTNYPFTILSYSRDNKHFHPTQKPVKLLEYLIKTYTLEGETVLDFTMGSGSTGIACLNLNRKFIGIEKDKNYFNIAKNRIENHIIPDSKEDRKLKNKGRQLEW